MPIDPDYPDERIEYILGDTNVRVIITNEKYKAKIREISKGKVSTLSIDSSKELTKALLKEPDDNPVLDGEGVRSTNLVYVIYTSGTTGNPKGVMVVSSASYTGPP